MPKAVVLLSGGLDSATTLALAKSQRFDVYALSVDYGQRHRVELERATLIATALGASEHRTVRLDLRMIGGSALTDTIEVPKASAKEMRIRDLRASPQYAAAWAGAAIGNG